MRVGGYGDDGTQPGLYDPNHEEEYSDTSHGVGTEYCGRVFYSESTSNPRYSLSTGIGTHRDIYGTRTVLDECTAGSNIVQKFAHCFYTQTSGSCPLGWGSRELYESNQPGCFLGTYYPSPVPAGAHSTITGSRLSDQFTAPKSDYHQFDWPAQDYNNVGIHTGCGPESFGSWYPVTNAWGGIYFVVVYEAKEYGSGFTTLGSLELTISVGIVMVPNFPMCSLVGPILTSTHGGYKVTTLKEDLDYFVRVPFLKIRAVPNNILLVLDTLTVYKSRLSSTRGNC